MRLLRTYNSLENNEKGECNMNSLLRSKNSPIEAIPATDLDFIREMVALPKESKLLARGIILGLGLTGQVSPTDSCTPMQT